MRYNSKDSKGRFIKRVLSGYDKYSEYLKKPLHTPKVNVTKAIDFDAILGKGFVKTFKKNMNKHNIRGSHGKFIKSVKTRINEFSDNFVAQEKIGVVEFVYQKFDTFGCLTESKWYKVDATKIDAKYIGGIDLNTNTYKNFSISKILGGIQKVMGVKNNHTVPNINNKLYALGYKEGKYDAQIEVKRKDVTYHSTSYKNGYNLGYDNNFT